MSESEQKNSLNPPEVDFLGDQTLTEATKEVNELFLDGKTNVEATEEVIEKLGGRMSNDEIHNLFD